MKTKDIKSRLNAEIENITPDVLDAVVKSSYIEKPSAQKSAVRKTLKRPSKKLIGAMLTCCLVLAFAITGLAVFLKPGVKLVSNATYVTVEIGNAAASAAADGEEELPSISFTADSNGKIETFRADNKAGEVVLKAISVDLKAKPLAEGVRLVVEASAKLGYIDVEATAETATACVKFSMAANQKLNILLDDVKIGIESYLKQSGIFAVVSGNAVTREKYVEMIKTFDSSASLDDSIESLNAKMAARKPFYEEEVNSLSLKEDNGLALLEVFARSTLQSFDDLIKLIDARKNALDNVHSDSPEEEYAAVAKLFNKESMNFLEITAKQNIYRLIDITTLQKWRNDLEEYIKNAAELETSIGSILTNINTALGAISELSGYIISEIPDNIAELGDYILTTAQTKAQNLESFYRDTFNKPRNAISDAEYANFTAKFKQVKEKNI